MIKFDSITDTPIEGEVAVPKMSFVRRDPNIIQLKTNYYKDVEILRPLNKAKFPVYLASYKGDKRTYAMKVFPLDDSRAQKYFKNEARFASLKHPHINQTVLVEQNKTVNYKGSLKIISFILSEFALYGDFFNFMGQNKLLLNEKLIRTYFHQLIEGLEYLHLKGIAHLDLKLENILVDENFQLKIADFDLSCLIKDPVVLSIGTQFYRAPELKNSVCRDFPAADVYSAGVILFVLMSGGTVPHSEDIKYNDLDLFGLLNNNNPEFWSIHCQIQNKNPNYYSAEFKKLFRGMTMLNPKERMIIQEIKNSEWFKGETFNVSEVKDYFKNLVGNRKESDDYTI